MQLEKKLTLLFSRLKIKSKTGIPILMYHGIDNSLHKNISSYYETNTSLKEFNEQIKYLKNNNYKVISLSTIRDHFISGSENVVVITFDDGLLNFYKNAFPVLLMHHIPATVFLPTKFIGTEKPGLEGELHMSWEQVRECISSGLITFGSHTVDHLRMEKLTYNEMEYQIRKSKEEIEEKTKTTVSLFSYPYRYPESYVKYKIEHFLLKCNYQLAVTTRIGTVIKSDNVLSYKRIPINEYDTISLFNAKLQGYYDWLYCLQKIKKKVYS